MIHHLAHIEPGVAVGLGSKVWQFASLTRKASLGFGCSVASCAIVDGAELGDNCIVGHGASVHPGCVAGDRVFIGPGAVICNDRWPSASKDGFDAGLLLRGEMVSVRLEDDCVIGANAVVLPGVIVGKGAMVAAGAVVSRSVPEGMVWTRLGDIVSMNEHRGPRMRPAC